MGEQMKLEARMSVRAPMQWSPGTNGGFSNADPKDVVRPPLSEGPYGFEHVNVSDQRAHPDSLLNWMASLIRVRKECSVIGTGEWKALRTENEAILGLRHTEKDVSVVTFVNLSDEEQTFSCDLSDEDVLIATELFQDEQYPALRKGGEKLTINGYGYRWIRVGGVY